MSDSKRTMSAMDEPEPGVRLCEQCRKAVRGVVHRLPEPEVLWMGKLLMRKYYHRVMDGDEVYEVLRRFMFCSEGCAAAAAAEVRLSAGVK